MDIRIGLLIVGYEEEVIVERKELLLVNESWIARSR